VGSIPKSPGLRVESISTTCRRNENKEVGSGTVSEGNEVSGKDTGSLSRFIVPKKVANHSEGATGGKGTVGMMEVMLGNTQRTLGREGVYTKQQYIVELARRMPQAQLNTLGHHIDLDWFEEAYRQTRKDGAVGVDGVTSAEYERELKDNLGRLLEELKSGTYVAPPVKREYIPKDGKFKELRPIGIPTLADKVHQRAIVMILEPIYEQDFLPCSYGFRPKRSVHQAIDKMRQAIMEMGGCWIYEADIQKFFDNVNHSILRTTLDERIGDGVIKRVVSKWLHAGVMEGGRLEYPEDGTPQGGVISPLLSNIYLHSALDKWFELELKPQLKGRAELIRFADDFLVLTQLEEDAKQVAIAVPKRLSEYGLTLNGDKTRVVDFRRPVTGVIKPQTLDFLGFTHYWGKSQRGYWVVKWMTAKKKLRRAIRAVYDKCRKDRHKSVLEQSQSLNSTLKGHYGFYGVTNNIYRLKEFYEAVKRVWRKWLDRRDRDGHMTWKAFKRVLNRCPLVRPYIVHSFI
jgi:RNA-directed DNA polymerase